MPDRPGGEFVHRQRCVQGRDAVFAARGFEGAELAVDETCRHEMVRAACHALGRRGAGQLEKDEAERGNRATQLVAIAALEGRAGEHRAFARRDAGRELDAEPFQPVMPVAVVERDAGAHLGDVGGGVEGVAFDQPPADARGDGCGDAGLAAAGDTHHHQGAGDGLHE